MHLVAAEERVLAGAPPARRQPADGDGRACVVQVVEEPLDREGVRVGDDHRRAGELEQAGVARGDVAGARRPGAERAASTLTAGRPSNSWPAPMTASVLAPTSTPGLSSRDDLGRHLLGLRRVLGRHEDERDVGRGTAEPGPDGGRRLRGAGPRVARSRRDVHRTPHRRHSMILQSVETSAVVEAEMKQSRSAFGVSSREALALPPNMGS